MLRGGVTLSLGSIVVLDHVKCSQGPMGHGMMIRIRLLVCAKRIGSGHVSHGGVAQSNVAFC